MKSLLAAAMAVFFLQIGGKLEIKDTVEGKGPAAQVGDILTVDYSGTLAKSGALFDTSVGKKPFQFILGAGQVIKGWDQGMVGMKVEGKRSLTIPSELGYGDKGAGDDIPPNATLKFDVGLIKIDRMETKILAPGKGKETAKAGDSCELHYQVTDTDLKKIDSSYDRKQTFQIVLGKTGLIKGFTAGVLGMKQGEKRRIVVPGEFAYGEAGRPPAIQPNATLIFEVEMVKLLAPQEIK
ncbi:MAG: FKBP-type peptidyl-prolyl cis-trans isomerase [Chlorobia bacterium]|nr:FKBP-type peptidyl-prolyl cis-trans isomerase [Fimbriimonadaceae bacterium]